MIALDPGAFEGIEEPDPKTKTVSGGSIISTSCFGEIITANPKFGQMSYYRYRYTTDSTSSPRFATHNLFNSRKPLKSGGLAPASKCGNCLPLGSLRQFRVRATSVAALGRLVSLIFSALAISRILALAALRNAGAMALIGPSSTWQGLPAS